MARSRGVWPSWFLMVGSAPWASSRAHSWVRPFCAASCSGVNAHLSVALTQVLCLISRAAMSTCWRKRDGEMRNRQAELFAPPFSVFLRLRVAPDSPGSSLSAAGHRHVFHDCLISGMFP